MGSCPLGPKEIDGLLVSQYKAYTLLTVHLITGKPLRPVPTQVKWFMSNHSFKRYWLSWVGFKHFLDVTTSLFWVEVP